MNLETTHEHKIARLTEENNTYVLLLWNSKHKNEITQNLRQKTEDFKTLKLTKKNNSEPRTCN